MKRLMYLLMVVALAATSCGRKGGSDAPALTVNFTISVNPATVGEPVSFTAEVTGGVAPYTYAWKVGEAEPISGNPASWTPTDIGNFTVTLTVTDANGTVASRPKNLAVQPAPVVATGEVALLWNCQLEGYTSITSPALADDGNIYTATRDFNHFYKISPSGEIVWTKALLNNPQSGSQIHGTPSIDSDGTIYMVGGTKNGDATVVAYTEAGVEKWRFTDFWNKGNAHSASIQGGNVAGIGTNNIYVGNVGSAGTVIAISKANGTRVNYVMGSDGNGPAGGSRGGIVVSKNGYIGWCGGSYGVFTAATADMDAAGEGTPWTARACHSAASGWSMGNNQATLAAMTIDGKDCLLGMQAIKDNSTSSYIYTKVYGVEFSTGAEIVNCKIDACAQQDQGGIAVTGDGLIIVPLKYSLGSDDGGIALVDPVQNQMVAHYRIAENVTSAPAVDQDNNIHFGTEAGNYYVVKYLGGGQFETLVKKDIIAHILKQDDRYKETYAATEVAKIWSGIVIGDDGKIYIQFTDNDNRVLGGLMCITLDYTTGPSTTSPWPMMGQNRKHTNHQI